MTLAAVISYRAGIPEYCSNHLGFASWHFQTARHAAGGGAKKVVVAPGDCQSNATACSKPCKFYQGRKTCKCPLCWYTNVWTVSQEVLEGEDDVEAGAQPRRGGSTATGAAAGAGGGSFPKPQYENIKRSVWLSRARPKRLPRDEMETCTCSVIKGASGTGCSTQAMHPILFTVNSWKFNAVYLP